MSGVERYVGASTQPVEMLHLRGLGRKDPPSSCGQLERRVYIAIAVWYLHFRLISPAPSVSCSCAGLAFIGFLDRRIGSGADGGEEARDRAQDALAQRYGGSRLSRRER